MVCRTCRTGSVRRPQRHSFLSRLCRGDHEQERLLSGFWSGNRDGSPWLAGQRIAHRRVYGAGWHPVCIDHLGDLSRRSDLLKEACFCSERIAELIVEDGAYDVVGGTAGCIKPILGLHGLAQDGHLLRTARRCGQHLLHNAQWGDPRLTAPTGLPVWRLTGFGHGAAGIAWALLHLAATTPDQRFRDEALRGISYERQLFSLAAGNWPDLRKVPTKSSEYSEQSAFMTAWCHGAVGIGLARLDTRAWLDGIADDEIRIALRTTIREGFGDNDSLCHGAMGNLSVAMRKSPYMAKSRSSLVAS